jgi:hypothetical protein
MISGTFVLLAAVVAIFYYIYSKPKWKNLPPGIVPLMICITNHLPMSQGLNLISCAFKKGPKGLPLIGNILQLEKQEYKTFSKWANEHGPIYKLDLATTR